MFLRMLLELETECEILDYCSIDFATSDYKLLIYSSEG